jgi:hypothetical protein
MIKDQGIAWNVKRDFIPAILHAGFLESAGTLTSLGAGAAVFQEILAAAQLAGVAIGAAGDEIFHLWKLPWDMDRDMPLAARIWFFHATTDTDNPDWVVSLKGLGNQQALTVATTSADGTLTFPALAVAATANALEKTSWQKTSGGIFAATDIFANIAVECNGLGSAGANEITYMGLELAYTIKATGESQMRDKTDVSLDGRSLY